LVSKNKGVSSCTLHFSSKIPKLPFTVLDVSGIVVVEAKDIFIIENLEEKKSFCNIFSETHFYFISGFINLEFIKHVVEKTFWKYFTKNFKGSKTVFSKMKGAGRICRGAGRSCLKTDKRIG